MSEDKEISTSCCASCGIAEVDDIKLKDCAKCDLVRYCSDACETDHKSEHEEACRERADELRDELLFKQPESTHLGDCPICFLPLPLDKSKITHLSCCSILVCNGCSHANLIREFEGKLKCKCAFCREPVPKTGKESKKQMMKRVAKNDPVAMYFHGLDQYEKGDYRKAFKWYSKAAKLGHAGAHYQLSGLYLLGHGVEGGMRKFLCHAEEAAIAGHPSARYLLGKCEMQLGNTERAVKHWIIAATQGEDDSMKKLMEAFTKGEINKVDLSAALRAHQAAVDATKSPQREEAECRIQSQSKT